MEIFRHPYLSLLKCYFFQGQRNITLHLPNTGFNNPHLGNTSEQAVNILAAYYSTQTEGTRGQQYTKFKIPSSTVQYSIHCPFICLISASGNLRTKCPNRSNTRIMQCKCISFNSDPSSTRHIWQFRLAFILRSLWPYFMLR